MTILLADDDKGVLTFLTELLEKNGYKVIPVSDGGAALDVYLDKHVDMLVCDEMMPELSGNDLVCEIRKRDAALPVIMVTAKGTTYDKKLSFGLGVDDYLVKPIDGEELLMRISAVCRRAKINNEMRITIGNVVLDSTNNTVVNIVDGIALTPTKTEFAILYKMFSYPEKIFTRWELYREFWGTDSEVGEGIVKVYISRIRRLIERFPEISIETVMRIGYRGVKNVE